MKITQEWTCIVLGLQTQVGAVVLQGSLFPQRELSVCVTLQQLAAPPGISCRA